MERRIKLPDHSEQNVSLEEFCLEAGNSPCNSVPQEDKKWERDHENSYGKLVSQTYKTSSVLLGIKCLQSHIRNYDIFL